MLMRDAESLLSTQIGNLFPLTRTLAVLLVAHMLHPIDVLAIEFFLNGNVRHSRCRSRTMPMLLARCKPDHIAWPDLFDSAVPALCQATARGDDQRLSERVRMPRRACAGFKGNAGTDDARRIGRASCRERVLRLV